LRGKAEAPGGKGSLDLDLGNARGEHAALQPFFQGPAGGVGSLCFNDEQTRRIETGPREPRSVRPAPFLCCRTG
jgi:hypothetical protein